MSDPREVSTIPTKEPVIVRMRTPSHKFHKRHVELCGVESTWKLDFESSPSQQIVMLHVESKGTRGSILSRVHAPLPLHT